MFCGRGILHLDLLFGTLRAHFAVGCLRWVQPTILDPVGKPNSLYRCRTDSVSNHLDSDFGVELNGTTPEVDIVSC